MLTGGPVWKGESRMGKRKKLKSRRGGKGGKFFRSFFSLVAGLFGKLVPLAMVALVGGAIFLGVRQVLYADSQLQVKTITVEPPLAISIRERQALEAKFLGKNVFLVDLKKIARDLEQDPEIARARVIRRFPSHLDIRIDRREPVGFIRFTPRDRFGLISEDGMILDVLPKPTLGMLLIEAVFMNPSNLRIGFQIRHKGFQEAVAFVKAYGNHEMAKSYALSKAAFDPLGNVSIQLGSGPEIRLGRTPVERISSLAKIVHLLSTDESLAIQYIDLQFDNVIVKKKGR